MKRNMDGQKRKKSGKDGGRKGKRGRSSGQILVSPGRLSISSDLADYELKNNKTTQTASKQPGSQIALNSTKS